MLSCDPMITSTPKLNLGQDPLFLISVVGPDSGRNLVPRLAPVLVIGRDGAAEGWGTWEFPPGVKFQAQLLQVSFLASFAYFSPDFPFHTGWSMANCWRTVISIPLRMVPGRLQQFTKHKVLSRDCHVIKYGVLTL